MGFAELPKELLQAILNFAIKVRGIKRGLRLRLVNKRFAAEVIDTIYTHRVLDGQFAQRLGPSQRPTMPPFTASYIEYRIHNNEDDLVPFPRLGFLRKVARSITAENDTLEYDDCVRLLCRLVSEGGAFRVYQVFCPALSLPTAFYEGDQYYVDNLFAAAVVTNTIPIVKRHIAIYQDKEFRPLLGTDWHEFYRLAARYANSETLGLLLSAGRSHGVDVPRRNDMLVAAAVVGRLSAFRFIHEYRIEETPWNFKDRTKRYASEKVFNDALETPSKDVWDHVIDLRDRYRCAKVVPEDRMKKLVLNCVQEGGDADLLDHLLELSADMDGFNVLGDSKVPSRPLLNACANGYEDLVRVLLSRGAITSCAVSMAAMHGQTNVVRLLLGHGANPRSGLLGAARGGYMGIARMLLYAGVDPRAIYNSSDLWCRGLERYGYVPIASAIAMEHVHMAKLLKEEGAEVYGYAGTECLRVAGEEGLESMLILLDEWGIHEM